MGKELQEDEDWLGFDKLAKMLGEWTVEDWPQPEGPARPAAEKPVEAENPPGDEGAAPKE
jgi:hypothetical protein